MKEIWKHCLMVYDLWFMKALWKGLESHTGTGAPRPWTPLKTSRGFVRLFHSRVFFSCKSIFKKYPCFKQPVLPCSARDERRDRNKQKGANQFLGSQVGFPTSVDHSHAFQMVSPRPFPRHQTISIMVIKEMRWRPPAHPCPVASSFFITVFIACRRGGLGGRFHVYGWALCWYVICVTDCGICNVITAIYVHMCMFVVRCICGGVGTDKGCSLSLFL